MATFTHKSRKGRDFYVTVDAVETPSTGETVHRVSWGPIEGGLHRGPFLMPALQFSSADEANRAGSALVDLLGTDEVDILAKDAVVDGVLHRLK